jgi:glycosyltransferase involved in cell wall biosynthesis
MKVSVLICTYKREAMLDKCLHCLIEGSAQKPDEIVVVDGDQGATGDIITRWKQTFSNIKMVPTKNINLAASRNIGLKQCRGDIVALTDDDVEVSRTWIAKIRGLHREHAETGGIGGRVIGSGQRLIDKVADLVIFPFGDRTGYVQTVSGANASYKREAIKECGDYDEALFRGEDVDYNWRILKSGRKIYYDPALIVYHHHRSNWRGLLKQLFAYGRAYYLIRGKWQDMYSVYPHNPWTLRGLLKLVYFFAGVIFEPLLLLRKVKAVPDKCAALPFLILCHLAWKCGIVTEGFNQKAAGLKNHTRGAR